MRKLMCGRDLISEEREMLWRWTIPPNAFKWISEEIDYWVDLEQDGTIKLGEMLSKRDNSGIMVGQQWMEETCC